MIASVPFLYWILKGTVGAVMMIEAPCSCRSRSSNTEQCSVPETDQQTHNHTYFVGNKPRNPNLHPCPRASECSLLSVTLLSLITN